MLSFSKPMMRAADVFHHHGIVIGFFRGVLERRVVLL